jgi:AraC family transcriptional regulator
VSLSPIPRLGDNMRERCTLTLGNNMTHRLETSSDHGKPTGADRPFFTTAERLDEIQSLSSVTFARGGLSIGRYRRDRPGLGISTPNPIIAMVMAVVIFRPRAAHVGWQDGRVVEVPALGAGALSCLDLREAWSMDLSEPFDSFHTFIPLTAFDEISSDLRRPRIERLHCPIGVEHKDDTMLSLARALDPVLARPEQATALFTDHVLSAMVTHLAVTYGGLNGSQMTVPRGRRRGMLTPLQERRVTSRLLDDLTADPSLAELAALCGLSRSYFIDAFKHTTGTPPHRWLLMQRVKRAKELLHGTKMTIAEIALACGFSDQSHLTRVFSKALGMSPAAWRRQCEN